MSLFEDAQPSTFMLTTDSNLGRIYKINITSGEVSAIPVALQARPFAITYDVTTTTVYWSDVTMNWLKRADITGANEMVFSSLLGIKFITNEIIAYIN